MHAADPYLQIRREGGGVMHTLRKVGGVSKKKFFRPQFGPKIRGSLDPPLS